MESAVNPRDKNDLAEVLRRALDNMGVQRPGKVTPRELSRAFESLGVRVSSKDILSLYDGLDVDRMGLLPHEDLVEALFGARYRKSEREAGDDYDRYVEMRRSRDGRDDSDVRSALRNRRDLVEEIVAQIRGLRGDVNKQLEVMNVEFRTVDTDKIGCISKSYFARALMRVGIKLPIQVEKDLIDTLTEGSSHEIKYSDFLDTIRAEILKNDQADDVVMRLKNRLSREAKHGRDLEDAFISIDRNGDGHIDVFEFENAMKKLGIPLSREESKRVLSRFSDNGVTIKHHDFMRAFRDCEGEVGGRGQSDSAGEDVASIINTIKHRIEDYLGPGYRTASKIKATFAEIDRDASGCIDQSEFRQAMKVLRVDLSSGDIDLLFRRFDRRGRGMDYKQFLDMLGFSGAARDVGSDEVIASIRRGINEYLGPGAGNARKVKDTFADIDRDGSGTIDKVEFKQAMRLLHVTVSPADIDVLFDRLDGRGRGLDYKQFIELLEFSAERAAGRDSDRGGGDRIDSIVRAVRQSIEDHLGPGARTARKIKETFAEIDRDRSNTIDKLEFEQAMRVLKVRVSARDIDELFRRYDSDGRGMNYREFIELLGFESSSSPRGGSSNSSSSAARTGFREVDEVEEAVQNIRRSIEEHLGPGARTARKIKETFSEMDRDRSNSIDKLEFEQAMKILRVRITSREVDAIFRRYDRDGRGLNYREFIELLNFDASAGAVRTGRAGDADAVDSIVKMVRRSIEDYLGPGARAARKIKETFADMDRDRSGKIDKREFAQAMKVLRVDLSDRDVDALFRRYDDDGRGLDYHNFIELIGIGSSSERKSDSDVGGSKVDSIIKMVRQSIEDHLGPGARTARKIKETFAEIDRDRSNTIDKLEFEQAMRVLKVRVSARDIDELFRRYDSDGRGMNYREFIELLGFESSSSPRGGSSNSSSSAARAGFRDADAVDSIVKMVRCSIEDYLGPGARAARKIKETFAEMDRDRSGKIDKREFAQAMKVLRVDLSDRDVDALFRRYDNDGRGLDYTDFIRLLDIR